MFGAAAIAACGGGEKSTGEAQTTAGKVDPDKAKALERADESADLINDMKGKVPASVIDRTQCVVAIPSMKKGGVIVGAAGGAGYSTCKTSSGWSAPTPVSIGGGTFGAQLGYQDVDLLALVTSPKGKKGLASGNFKVGADASATAGPVGTGVGAGTDWNSNADIVSYSRSKGLFAGAELNGTSISLDKDSTKALYGPGHDMNAMLSGNVHATNDPNAQKFLSAVRSVFGDGMNPMQ